LIENLIPVFSLYIKMTWSVFDIPTYRWHCRNQ